MRTCAGSGKHDLTHTLWREKIPRGHGAVSLGEEMPEGPRGHRVTSPGDISSSRRPPAATLRRTGDSQRRVMLPQQRIMSLITNQLLLLMKTSAQHDSRWPRTLLHFNAQSSFALWNVCQMMLIVAPHKSKQRQQKMAVIDLSLQLC